MIVTVARDGAANFPRFSNYLVKDSRHTWQEFMNLTTSDHRTAAILMQDTASLNPRVKKPKYAMTLSWPAHEKPDRQTALQIFGSLIADLELSEHQAHIVCHDDTENRHLQVNLNRVNPRTLKAWAGQNDYARIEKSLRRMEREYGFTYVPGRHSDPAMFTQRGNGPVRGEHRLGRRIDKTPIPEWTKPQQAALREALRQPLNDAKSWDALEDAIMAAGIEHVGHPAYIYAKARGLVLTDFYGSAKLSKITREHRKQTLEQRFNETFEAYEERREAARQELRRTYDAERDARAKSRIEPDDQPNYDDDIDDDFDRDR